jgi:cell division protein FtsA
MNELAIALDIGTSKTVCLAASAEPNGGMKVHGLGIAESRGVRKGTIEHVEDASAAVQLAIDRLEAALQRPVGEVAVALSGPGVQGANGQGFKPIVPRSRSITHQDVLEVVNHSRSLLFPADREQVQAIPREYRVDAQRNVKQPVGLTGAKLEVITYLVTAPVAQLQTLERAVRAGERAIGQMVLGPLASGLAVATPEDLEAGVAVVDLGAGKTDVALFANGSIVHSVSIPIGAQHVTRDIATLVKCSTDEAERIKLDAGSALASAVLEEESVQILQVDQATARPMQRRVLCEIIEARLRETAGLVRQEIERSGLNGILPGGLILTGGGASLRNVDRLFDESLQHVRVRVIEPRAPGSNRAGLATALGVARFALDGEDVLATANSGDWRTRVRSLWTSLSGKASWVG